MKSETSPTQRQVASESAERLVREHGPAVLGYLVKFCGQRADAEDCFQETFRRFVEKGQDVPEPAQKNWLFRVATNVARDGYRARLRHPQTSLDQAPEAETFNDPPAGSPEPLDQVSHQEQATVVRQALVTLPEQQRAVLILSFYQKRNYREIAAMLDCSVSTVKTHMSRALASLARRLPDPG